MAVTGCSVFVGFFPPRVKLQLERLTKVANHEFQLVREEWLVLLQTVCRNTIKRSWRATSRIAISKPYEKIDSLS